MAMRERPDDDAFLSRWSQRKQRVRAGEALPDAPPAAIDKPPQAVPAWSAPVVPAAQPVDHDGAGTDGSNSADKASPPTLDDVASLNRDADFSRFVAADVGGDVRNAALHKLFSDPHFNVMDGLDIYIGDYNTADPLPASMLRQMVQARALGLFTEEEPAAPQVVEADNHVVPLPPIHQAPDEDADLRLQPLDAAGREGPEPGAGEDGTGQH